MQPIKYFWKLTSILMAAILTISLGWSSSVAVAQESTPASPPWAGMKLNPQYVQSILPKKGPTTVMVELADEPAAVVYAKALQASSPVLTAQQNSFNQMARIQQAQADLTRLITSPSINAKVIYSLQRVYNGIAIQVNAQQLSKISGQPGVKKIHPLIPKTMNNSYSVPLIGATKVWELGSGLKGDLIKIGVIDSGIDYLHVNFGGSQNYPANNPTIIGDVNDFPGVKVAGGYDFAGDLYDASSQDAAQTTPVPDPDPMDCNGHGSHVAGTIAGYGVDMAGETYTGSYNNTFDYTTLSIGPGVAPKAVLYALKVFGCKGSTLLTDQAIEWAVDPNQDGNFSDHLDVINIALGSSQGTGYDTTAVAADNAALVGVIVVAPSGNYGDTYYMTNSPASATRAISVASSQDAGGVFSLGQFQINTPDTIQGLYVASEANFGVDLAASGPLSGDIGLPPAGKTQSGCLDSSNKNPYEATAFTNKIALLENGNCEFAEKVANAQNAGAIGVLLYQNNPGTPPIPMTGFNPTITIPVMMTNQETGNSIKNAVGTVRVTLTAEHRYEIFNNPGANPALIDTISNFTSRGPRRGDSFLKPDLTAPGDSIFSTAAGSGDKGTSMSGSSQASAQVAGLMALLRQLHPAWSVEELKALAMNTANHNVTNADGSFINYPGRVGTGRVDALLASQSSLVLYNAEDQGAVSVSFGDVAVSGIKSLTKTITVKNNGTYNTSFTVKWDNQHALSVEGVNFELLDMAGNSLPPNKSLGIKANNTTQFKVKMTADASKLVHAQDPTTNPNPNGYLSRHWLTEAEGMIILHPSGGNDLWLPVHAVPHPVSKMKAAKSLLPTQNPTLLGSIDIRLLGSGVDTSSDILQPPTAYRSLVSPFELAAASPNENMATQNPAFEAILDSADIKYVGITSDRPARASTKASTLYLGINSYGNWSSPNDVLFVTYFDVNNDSKAEYALGNVNFGAAMTGNPTDDYISALLDLNAQGAYIEGPINIVPSDTFDTNLFNGSVMVLPVRATDLGLKDEANTSFHYWVETYDPVDFSAQIPVDRTPVLTYDAAHPALDTVHGSSAMPYADVPLYYDQASTSDPATILSFGILEADKPAQLLLLHYHNADTAGSFRGEVLYTLFMPNVRK